MTKKTLATGLVALALTTAVVPASLAAEATTTTETSFVERIGNFFGGRDGERPALGGERGGRGMMNSESRDAIDAAIEANDYEAFLAAHSSIDGFAENMTEEKFAEIVARHAERETRQAEREARREKMQALVAAGDYEGWVAAHEEIGREIPAGITADNFGRFAEMHAHRETARKIADELGLQRGHGKMDGSMHHGGGMRNQK